MERLAVEFRCKRNARRMMIFFRYLLILIFLVPINSFALIEVDISRGNLAPLPIAVSPLSLDKESKNNLKKLLKKEDLGSEISIVVENSKTDNYFTEKIIFIFVFHIVKDTYSNT